MNISELSQPQEINKTDCLSNDNDDDKNNNNMEEQKIQLLQKQLDDLLEEYESVLRKWD